jgi:hypothetical protein
MSDVGVREDIALTRAHVASPPELEIQIVAGSGGMAIRRGAAASLEVAFGSGPGLRKAKPSEKAFGAGLRVASSCSDGTTLRRIIISRERARPSLRDAHRQLSDLGWQKAFDLAARRGG